MHGDHCDTAARMFGLVLRHLRLKAGLSQRALGRAALYDHTRISRAEQGEILIPLEHVRELDRALDAGGLLVELRTATPRACLPLASKPGVHDRESVMLDIQTSDGRTVRVTISRRDFANLLATGTIGSVLPSLGDIDEVQRVAKAVEQPTRVDTQVIDYFRRLLAEHYTADKMIGPRCLLRPVLAQIDVLDGLRRGARGHIEPLLQVLAQYAEMVGWLYQDLGELQTAMAWSRRAAEWAQVAGDDDMAAYMLIRQANIAYTAEDYATAVQYAAAAQRHPDRLEPRLLALAAQQQARGLAMLGEGEHGTAFALIDQARQLLCDHPEVARRNAPVYLHHYDIDTLEEQSAACYLAAGQADVALSILERKIAALPENTRDRGHLTAKLAVAVARSSRPDPDRAVHLGHEALSVAHQTGSARIRLLLRRLDAELRHRWPNRAETRAFHEALSG